MSSFELNKIAAAILVAGIIAVAAGILSNNIVKPHELDKPVIEIAGMEDTGSSPSGPEKQEGPGSIVALLAVADLSAGENAFKKCVACHTIEKGEAHRQGPNLWGVVGAKVAHHADYTYSKAMAAHGGEWDFDTLNGYLFKPARYVKGTKMTFVGISKDEERANLIAYLRTKSDSPLPLPEVIPPAAEVAVDTALETAEAASEAVVEGAPTEVETELAPAE